MGRRISSRINLAILEVIEVGGEVFEYGSRRPASSLRDGIYGLKAMNVERARLRVQLALYRLKQQKLLEEIRLERERVFRLTKLGEKILQRAFCGWLGFGDYS